MKILLTNYEMENASRLQVLFSVSVGTIIFLFVVALVGIVLLFAFHLLTAIPLKIYLVALIELLVLIFLRLRKRTVAREP